jgi:hypothetical protein
MPVDVKGILRDVFDGIRIFRKQPTGDPPVMPGSLESAQLLRAVPTLTPGPVASEIFKKWRADDPGQLSFKINNDGQSKPAGQTLDKAPSVIVLDKDGDPTPGIPVLWIIEKGKGAIPRTRVVTDPKGMAAVPWTLGPDAGENTLVASIEGSNVTFTATAT